MQAFLREYPISDFSQGLPLLRVIVFLLVSGIPALLVDTLLCFASSGFTPQTILPIPWAGPSRIGYVLRRKIANV